MVTRRQSELIQGVIYFTIFGIVCLIIALGCQNTYRWDLAD